MTLSPKQNQPSIDFSEQWRVFEAELRLDNHDLDVYRQDLRGSRAYILEGRVIKAQLNSELFRSTEFYQNLKQEHEALRWVAGDRRFVQSLDYCERDIYRYLVLERVPGVQLGERSYTVSDALVIIIRLLSIGISLSVKRMVHGDMAPHNFIVSHGRFVTLIDFGLAQKAPFQICLWRNLIARGTLNGKRTFPISGSIVRVVEYTLPPSWRARYRKILGIAPYKAHAPSTSVAASSPRRSIGDDE
ncbi:phosphotransferase [Roseinatronobacter sp.]